jgi:hypothetical protein
MEPQRSFSLIYPEISTYPPKLIEKPVNSSFNAK